MNMVIVILNSLNTHRRLKTRIFTQFLLITFWNLPNKTHNNNFRTVQSCQILAKSETVLPENVEYLSQWTCSHQQLNNWTDNLALKWIPQHQNDRVTPKKHFGYEAVLVHWLGLLLSFTSLWNFSPHLLHIFQDHVAVPNTKIHIVFIHLNPTISTLQSERIVKWNRGVELLL